MTDRPEISPETDGASRYSRLELDRLRKVDQLRQQGIDPFPARIERTHSVEEAIALYVECEDSFEGDG